VVGHGHRRHQDVVRQTARVIGKGQEFLPQQAAIAFAREPANAADAVCRQAAFDFAGRDGWMPFRQSVEVAHQLPDLVRRRVNDCTAIYLDHGSPPLFYVAFTAEARRNRRERLTESNRSLAMVRPRPFAIVVPVQLVTILVVLCAYFSASLA